MILRESGATIPRSGPKDHHLIMLGHELVPIDNFQVTTVLGRGKWARPQSTAQSDRGLRGLPRRRGSGSAHRGRERAQGGPDGPDEGPALSESHGRDACDRQAGPPLAQRSVPPGSAGQWGALCSRGHAVAERPNCRHHGIGGTGQAGGDLQADDGCPRRCQGTGGGARQLQRGGKPSFDGALIITAPFLILLLVLPIASH